MDILVATQITLVCDMCGAGLAFWPRKPIGCGKFSVEPCTCREQAGLKQGRAEGYAARMKDEETEAAQAQREEDALCAEVAEEIDGAHREPERRQP